MAAGTFLIYDFACKYVMNGTADLDGASVAMALATNSYTPDQVNDINWANVSAAEITAANGYTAGGITLASPVFTAVTKGFKFSSTSPVWTATGGSIAAWRYMILYINATVNSVVKPLLGYCLGDSTPADIPATTVGNTLTLTCPAAGWLDTTRP